MILIMILLMILVLIIMIPMIITTSLARAPKELAKEVASQLKAAKLVLGGISNRVCSFCLSWMQTQETNEQTN